MPLLLTCQDVESLLTMRATIRIVENTFRDLAQGRVRMARQTTLDLSPGKGSYRLASAHVKGQMEGLGLRVLGSNPDNPRQHGLPTVVGTLLLNDPETGVPLAIMDATFLTAMCSGAAGAVAAKYLARQKVNEVTIFGSGLWARIHLMGICAVRSVNGAIVVDADAQARAAFADQMSKALDIPIEPVEDVQAAVEMANVIVIAGRARKPLFPGEWIRPGVHINAVSNSLPEARDVDAETIRRAKVVPDLTSACLAQAGDLIAPIQEGIITKAHLHADLGHVVAGLAPGREAEEEITLFKSVGLAMHEVATAIHLYNLASQRGAGKVVDF